MSAVIDVASVRAQVQTAASNLPLALTIKIVKGAQGALCNVPYAFPDISGATIQARAMAVGAAVFPLTWNRSYAPAINASSNTLSTGVTDSQLVVSGCVGYGSNSVLMSRYMQDYGASVSLLQTSNLYYLVSTEGGNTFFSVGTSNDGRLTYGLSNSAFGVSTACVMQQNFGLGTCNLAVGLCNPVLGSVAPTLKSAWNLSNAKYYPKATWNLKPPIVAAGGQSYTDSNFGLAVALSNYTSFPDTALSFSVTSNTNANVPFSTTGNFANVLTLSGGHAAVAAGSNTGTLTLTVVNSLDTTGFAVACNVDVPYTVFALAPVGTTVTPSSLKLGTTGAAHTLSNLSGYVTARAGGAYTYAVLGDSNPHGNVSVNAATGALTVARLTSNVSYTVGVKVTDQFSQSNTQSIPLISVRPPDAIGAPSALALGSIGAAHVLSGFPGYFATQPLGDPYVYSVATNPRGNVSVNASTGALTIARLGINATYTAGVRLTDGVSQSVTQSIVLTSVPPATVNGALNAVVKSSSNSSFPTFSSVGFNVMTGGTYSYALSTNQLNNAAINAETGALTVTGVSGCNAVYSVGVSAVDQFSQASQRLITLTSVPPPTANGVLAATVKSLSNVSLPTFGSSGFNLKTGGTYIYSLTTDQLTNAVVDSGTGALTVTGVSGCNAVYSVGITAVDQFSQSVQQTIALTSVPLPTANAALAAVVKSLSNVSLPTFGSTGFNLKTGGTYVYSLTTDQLSNASVDAGTGALTVTGVSGCNAVYSVGVSAIDQFSQAVQQTIALTSVPPPTANAALAAVVKSLSNVSLPTFGSAGFNLKTGGTYVYSVTTDQLSNAVVDAGTGSLTVTGVSGCNAVYSVGITAVDQFSQSAQRAITLTSVPPPTANAALAAVVKSLSNVSLPTFGSSGFNLKTGGTYTYSLTTDQLTNAVVDAGTGALTVTGVSGCNAVYSVGVSAIDQFSQSDQRSITLTSVPPPTAKGTLAATVKSLSNVSLPTFGSTGFNIKTGGTYVYSVTTDQLSNAVVDTATGALTVTGVSGCNAVYSVGVTAVDQFSQSVQQTIALTSVIPPAAIGSPTAVTLGTTGAAYLLDGFASYFTTQPGGTPYVYSITANPSGNVSVNAATGALTVARLAVNATYAAGVTLTDGLAQSVTQSIGLTSVLPPAANGAPTAVVLGTGTAYVLSGFASYFTTQPGGTPYVYSITANPSGNVSVNAATGALTVARLAVNATYVAGVTLTDGLAQSVTQSIGLTSVIATQSGWLSHVFLGYFADNVAFFATATLLQSVYTTDTTNLSTCTNAYLGVDNAVQRSVQMTGFYLAGATGTYTITLAADDAAYLWLGNTAIAGYTTGNATINNGGFHPVVLMTATYAMTAGSYYPVRVQYGDGGGGSDLQISFTPPGGVQTYVGTGTYYAPPPTYLTTGSYTVNMSTALPGAVAPMSFSVSPSQYTGAVTLAADGTSLTVKGNYRNAAYTIAVAAANATSTSFGIVEPMPPVALPPGCRGLYSLFLLNAAYGGPVVGCRRSSDNATSDFYNIDGQLCMTPAGTTTATIGAWLTGGYTAYVATWYDQSGAGKNATMGTTSSQPYVNVNTMRVTFGGSQYLSLPDGTIPYGNTTYTVTVKHGALSGTAGMGLWGSGTSASGNMNSLRYDSTYNHFWYADPFDVTSAPSDGNVVTCKYDQAARFMYVNGAQVGTKTNVQARNSTSVNNMIGRSISTIDHFLNGDLYYLAIFADSLSDQSRLTVEGLYSTSAMSRVLDFDGQNLASVGAGNAITTWANTSGLLGTSYAATAYNSPLAGAVTATAVAFPPFAMTANTSSPGSGTYVASASSSNGTGEDVWNAFDGAAGTQWTIGSYTWYNNGVYVAGTSTTIDGTAYKGEWIQFKMPYTAKATTYSFKTHPTDTSRCPSAWALAGSIDGASWVLLDVRTGQTTAANTQYSYATNTSSEFSHFRLVTTALAASGGQAWYSLQDFRVYAAPVRYHAGFVGASSQYFNITKSLPFTWFSNSDVYAGLTVFVVAQLTATTGVTWERFFDFGNGSSNDNILLGLFGGVYTLTLDTYNGAVAHGYSGVNFTADTTSFHVFAMTINNTASGYTASFYVDGCTAASAVAYTTRTVATPIENRTTVNNYIGRSNWAGDAFLYANVRQIAMYNSSLSAADMALAYQQITSRWGMYLDGSTPQRAAASAAAIKTLTGTNVDGVYWIDLLTVGPTQVYCIMDSAVSGGGWMLALKAAATGTTFSYASTHWTTATTTLNPTDTTRSAGDAKFNTFNYFASADMMAIWPDITTTGGTISLPASYGSWCWLKTAYNSGTRQALTSFFSTASNESFGTAEAEPPRFPEAGANIFSQQAGNAFYGANFTLCANNSVRWGVAFNNDADWLSNDVMGGIGIGAYGGTNFSAGDVYECCGSAIGINRQARVEMYVR
jgi:hypothetical protein